MSFREALGLEALACARHGDRQPTEAGTSHTGAFHLRDFKAPTDTNQASCPTLRAQQEGDFPGSQGVNPGPRALRQQGPEPQEVVSSASLTLWASAFHLQNGLTGP